ncbi:MAG: hypothetical protein RML12_02300 [Xanthomonadales bacterium]|nr:hypothetical protein [Xanthomonadales bacterium]
MPGLLLALALALDGAALEPLEVRGRRAERHPTRPVASLPAPRERLLRHPAELLALAPGVWLSRGSGQESLLALRSPVLTGPGSCGAFLILDDGIPVRPVGFCNVNQVFETAFELAEGLWVLRGPGAVGLGGAALHGAIGLRPPPLTGSPALAVEGGAFARRGLRLELPLALGAGRLRLDALGVESDGFREREGFRQHKLLLQWQGAEEGPRLSLVATRLRQRTAGFVAGEGAWRDRRRFANPTPEAFRDADALRLALHGGEEDLRWRAFLRRDAQRFLQHFILGQPREDNGSASLGLALRRAAGAAALGLDVEAAWGEVREWQERELTAGPPLQRLIRPAGRHYDFAVRSLAIAGFLERAGTLGAGWWHAGLRGELLGLDYDNRMAPGNLREDGTPCPAPGGCLFQRPADRRDALRRGSPPSSASPVRCPRGRRPARGSRAGSGCRRCTSSTGCSAARRWRTSARSGSRASSSAGVGIGRGPSLALELFAYRKRDLVLRDAAGFLVSGGRTRHFGAELSFARALGSGFAVAGQLSLARHRYAFTRELAGGERIVAGRRIDSAPRRLVARHAQPPLRRRRPRRGSCCAISAPIPPMPRTSTFTLATP